MKIGAIIPTRGDRKQFLEFALERIKEQTMPIDIIELVDDPPASPKKDITWRYRVGCDRVFSKGADVAFLWEDDDWYDVTYVERMVSEWIRLNKPALFGIGETTYYHLKTKGIYHEVHKMRASAMSTMVTPFVCKMRWPSDNEAFTDIHMWRNVLGKTTIFEKNLSLGIKHSVGLPGGSAHNPRWAGYRKKDDESYSWLKGNIDKRAFDFYTNIAKTLK